MSKIGMEWLRGHLWYKVLRRLPPLSLTVRTRHGVLRISSRDQAVGRPLFICGEFDFDKIGTALRVLGELGYVPSKGMLLNVGANIGTVVLPLLRGGWFPSALAVEPVPQIARLLQESVHLNGLDGRMGVSNVALSDHEGVMRLQLSADNQGDNRIVVGEPEEGWQTIDVPVRRLDDILESQGVVSKDVGLVWMDVQGHEYHVLKGAERLLLEGVPLIMEFWPYGLMKAKVDVKAYDAYLRRFYGRFCDLSEEGCPLRPIEEFFCLFKAYKGESYTDLLFVK